MHAAALRSTTHLAPSPARTSDPSGSRQARSRIGRATQSVSASLWLRAAKHDAVRRAAPRHAKCDGRRRLRLGCTAAQVRRDLKHDERAKGEAVQGKRRFVSALQDLVGEMTHKLSALRR
eukprot:6202870-Pleurochrysis_carterae.AAC.1